jgi:LysM repeat protein
MKRASASGVILLAALATVLLLASPSSEAGEKRHTVRAGESASAIAKRYYGDYEKAALLLLYNGRSSSTIRAGETLRVPYAEPHVVRPGDSWSALAERCCGRTSVYPALAALNGMSARRPLPAGARIVLPAVFTHTLGRGESLALLAERWYGDAELGDLLQQFNEIDDPRRLSVGQRIEIPLTSLVLKDSDSSEPEVKKTASAPAERRPPPQPVAAKAETRAAPAFTAPLREAESDFVEGAYSAARSKLESLREPLLAKGTNAEKAELYRLLGYVYVAYDLSEEACAAERRRLALLPFAPPPHDADLVSPKIRETLAACGPG